MSVRTIATSIILALCIQVTDVSADEKGWLGVQVEEMTPSMRNDHQLGNRFGLLVVDVIARSPADRAGIIEEDVILSFDGTEVETYDAFAELVGRAKPGTNVTVTVHRDGETQNIVVKITARKSEPVGRHRMGRMFKGKDIDDFQFDFQRRARLGVRTHDLDEDLASYFGHDSKKGALVFEVVAESPAEKAGIKSGDIILKVGEHEIDNAESLARTISDFAEGDKVTLTLLRKGKQQKLDTTLDARPFFGKNIEQWHFRAPDGKIQREIRLHRRHGGNEL